MDYALKIGQLFKDRERQSAALRKHKRRKKPAQVAFLYARDELLNTF